MTTDRTRKPSFLAMVILILYTQLTACDQSSDKQTSDSLTTVIAVGSQWYGHIPVWVGIERGIFKKHGFDMQWRFIGKSMDRLNAISSGEAQLSMAI